MRASSLAPGHAHGLLDSALVVDDEFLRQHMQDLLTGRDPHGPDSRVDHAIHIAMRDFIVADDLVAIRIPAFDMAAGYAREHGMDLAAGHELGLAHGALYRLHGRFDIDHHAFFEATRGIGADADDLDAIIGGDLAHDRHHLGGADIQPHDQIFVRLFSHISPLPARCRC